MSKSCKTELELHITVTSSSLPHTK